MPVTATTARERRARTFLRRWFAAKEKRHIGTANTVADLPPPLRDRCRILRFPAPDLTHLPQLAAQVLVDLMTERGLDASWANPLSGQELDAIAQVWKGGSVRVLRRLVEGVMNVREQLEPFH